MSWPWVRRYSSPSRQLSNAEGSRECEGAMKAPEGILHTPQKSLRSRLVVQAGLMVRRAFRQVKFPICRIISIFFFTGWKGESRGESCHASPFPLPVVFHHRVLAPFG